jgi:hypothetical protein
VTDQPNHPEVDELLAALNVEGTDATVRNAEEYLTGKGLIEAPPDETDGEEPPPDGEETEPPADELSSTTAGSTVANGPDEPATGFGPPAADPVDVAPAESSIPTSA